MAFEDKIQESLFKGTGEKTFIDKLLAKDENNRVMELIKKEKLTREELLEILYHLSGTEIKLVNFGSWDRYVILKFFVWIREFIKVAENLYDYQDDLRKKSLTCSTCKKLYEDFKKEKKECTCKEPKPFRVLGPRTRKLIYNNERNIEHASKFLIDLYFNIARSSLSIGATAFLEMLKSKFEISYPEGQQLHTPMQQQPKSSIFGIKRQ